MSPEGLETGEAVGALVGELSMTTGVEILISGIPLAVDNIAKKVGLVTPVSRLLIRSADVSGALSTFTV